MAVTGSKKPMQTPRKLSLYWANGNTNVAASTVAPTRQRYPTNNWPIVRSTDIVDSGMKFWGGIAAHRR